MEHVFIDPGMRSGRAQSKSAVRRRGGLQLHRNGRRESAVQGHAAVQAGATLLNLLNLLSYVSPTT